MRKIFLSLTLLLLTTSGAAYAGENLLHNPDLEGEDGFTIPEDSYGLPGNFAWVYRSIGEIQSPTWWFPFWQEGPVVNEPERNYRRPEYKVTLPRAPWVDPPRIDSGSHSLQFFGSFGAIDAGIYQQVEVEKGQKYRFSARGHSWSSCQEDFRQSGECDNWDPEQTNLLVGMDVTGATDFLSPGIVWGESAHHYDAFGDIPPVEAVAEAETITVFIRSRFKWAYVHNDTFIDTAKLVRVEE